MYHEVGIQRLSDNQLSKLRNGHSVRIKLGNVHKIALSVQQLKKLHKAHKKGAATTISFDPYQTEQHGAGILGDIAKKAKAFIQKHKLQSVINPLINHARNMGHKGVSKLSHFAHSKVHELQPIDGGGPVSDVLGLASNIGGPVGTAANVASKIANMFGFGAARKHNSATVKRRAKRTTKKGKGIIGDFVKAGAKEIAKKGIEIGTDYLKNKVDGMAVVQKHRRIVGRKPVASRKKRTHSGGAMYPAGGAMYPAGGAMYPAGGAMYPAGGALMPSGYGGNSAISDFANSDKGKALLAKFKQEGYEGY